MLMEAARRGHTEIVRLLIEKGAALDERTSTLHTALTLSARRGRTEVVRLLVDAGAALNAKTKFDNTALILAIGERHPETAQLLIESGADTSIQGYEGTAMALARRRGLKNIVKILEDKEERENAGAILPPLEASETWVLMGTEQIAHIGVYPEAEKKITKIFNFASRERLILSENLGTQAETSFPVTSFGDLPDAVIEKAFEEFKKLGGTADKEYVLRGTETLPGKPKFGA